MLTLISTDFVTGVETERFLAEKTAVYKPGVVGVPVIASVEALNVMPAGRPVAVTVGFDADTTETGKVWMGCPGS